MNRHLIHAPYHLPQSLVLPLYSHTLCDSPATIIIMLLMFAIKLIKFFKTFHVRLGRQIV